MAEKIVITLEVDARTGIATVGGLEKSVNSASKATEETGKSVDGLTGKLDKMTGGAISGFKNFVSGARSGIAAMNGLKVAIAATGIGALVIAILAVKTAFESSEEGQNKFAKIMSVINVVVGNFVDILAGLGELIIAVFENPGKAISAFGNLLKDQIVNRVTGMLELLPALGKAIKLALSGDFAEAALVAGDAIGKVTLGVEDATAKIVDLTAKTKDYLATQANEIQLAQQVADARAKADKIERSLLVERAKREGEIAELRLKARQEEQFTAAERKAFLLEAKDLQDGLISQETEVLQLRSDAISLENTFSRSNKAALDEEAQAKAALIRQDAVRLNSQREFQRELNTTTAQANALAAASAKERLDAQEKIDTAIRTSRENEIFETRKKYNDLIDLARKYGQDTVELERLRREELAKLDPDRIDPLAQGMKRIQAELETERTIQTGRLEIRNKADIKSLESARKNASIREQLAMDEANAKLMVFTGLAASLSHLLGQETAAGKAAAIAAATISTYVGAANALKIYGPTPVGYAALAGALVTGFAQVKAIIQTKVPGGGGNGGAGQGSFAPRPPSIGNSIGLINPTGQGDDIGRSLAQGLGQQPMRAFVVSEDVQSGLDLENRIRSSGQFG